MGETFPHPLVIYEDVFPRFLFAGPEFLVSRRFAADLSPRTSRREPDVGLFRPFLLISFLPEARSPFLCPLPDDPSTGRTRQCFP